MSTNATVFVGLWTDWSKGRILGPTLTLPIRDGNILISVISLFIQLTGGQSWSILCFIVHQLRTTRKEQDGLYYQQQATLRNNASDAGTAWKLAKIGLFHVLLFAAAGTLSSHIITVGNDVLLATNPSCGLWNSFSIVNESQFVEAVDLTLNQRNTLAFSNQYVQNCLGGSKSSPACNTFRTPQLNWTFVTDAPCPFQDDICLGPTNGTLQINTGYIDSRDDLGINGDDTHRIQYRKQATCMPLVTDGYLELGNSSRDGMNFTYEAAFYGPNNVLNSSLAFNGAIGRGNDTALLSYYPDQDVNVLACTEQHQFCNPNPAANISNECTPFLSIDAFINADQGFVTDQLGKIMLNSYQKNIASIQPKHTSIRRQRHSLIIILSRSRSANISNECTPFLSIDAFINADQGFVTDQLGKIMLNSYQKNIASIIQLAAWNSGFDFVVTQTDPALMASGLCVEGASPPLPPNQWILEATNWFSIGMVNIQRRVVDTATGPPGVDAQYTLDQASDSPAMEWYCANQIVQRTDFTSFSVLTLSLIFGFGGLLICTSLFLETVVGWWQLRYRKGLYQQVRWQLDSTLQLQRMAFEEVGLGTWRGGAEDVPTTEKGEVFVPAEEWDEWHPRIAGKAM
ncbi:uncharacterized protein PAC_05051 [Phialocephala subalpina]|uniref:Uncharacterized protein n=1 Tax=Phialocephala subalpina TaxID=576137 RepID=A0A1L7WQY4_9HELO|nr:uncharacterized protein PAC_05051 [Phialocephala subalpina]